MSDLGEPHVYISQSLYILSRNSKFISHNSDFCEGKTQNSEK